MHIHTTEYMAKKEKKAQCPFHPSLPAVANCQKCNAPMCKECVEQSRLGPKPEHYKVCLLCQIYSPGHVPDFKSTIALLLSLLIFTGYFLYTLLKLPADSDPWTKYGLLITTLAPALMCLFLVSRLIKIVRYRNLLNEKDHYLTPIPFDQM